MSKKKEKRNRCKKVLRAIGSILLTAGSMIVMPHVVNWGASKISKLTRNKSAYEEEWEYEPKIVHKGKGEDSHDRK